METDDYPLRVGDTFASNTDLQTYMTKVIDDTCELFTRLRSDKLYPSHFKNASLSKSEIDNVIKKLEYLRITYKCKYGHLHKNQNKMWCKDNVTLGTLSRHKYKLF